MSSTWGNKKNLFTALSVILLLLIWKITALAIGADIIFPPPEKVILSLFTIISEEKFLFRLFSTIIRGIFGFTISLTLGVLIGIPAGVFPYFKRVVAPFISIIRSTPVISIILLALIWFNVNNVPVFVAFLMGFPIICGNIIEGITTVDNNLLEMAQSYKIPLKKQVLQIYIPSTLPFIVSGASISIGVIWKVIVAAEVLSQPKWGVGTSLNDAKMFLVTEEVFAWTVIAIMLTALSEVIFKIFSEKLNRRLYGD